MTKNRCAWCISSELYQKYHDEEWGKPVYDDHILFEFLILETFQAGLSWITILNKRNNFKKAFDDFDYHKIADYTEIKQAELLTNTGIIRNKLKIKATISNATAFIKIQAEFGTFSKYVWSFVGGKPLINNWTDLSQVPASTDISDALSQDLKKRGFKFVGSKIIYAYMQATGMVNGHVLACWLRQ